MTNKVDFYILKVKNEQASLLFTCRLLEKFYEDNQRILVQTNGSKEADHLDSLLWTYQDDKFLPHQIYRPNDKLTKAIQITSSSQEWIEDDIRSFDILVNLSKDIPKFYHHFPLLIEIVFADALVQQLARERFKQYRQLGLTLNTISE